MSDFTAVINAQVDTSKAEAQLQKLTQNKKMTIDVDTKGSGFDNLNSGLQKAQQNANALGISFKEIAATKLKYDVFNGIADQAKEAVKAVTDLNSAMTLVNMTMSNMNEAALDSLKNQSLQLAQDLSTYTKTITDAVTIYANENESAASILTKATPTALLASAASMKASDAADAIQGIMNQFGLAEDQAMHVADTIEKLSTEISMDFSKGVSDISKAISVSGAVIDEAGMSFEKYAALVSTTAEKTRRNGSEIGNAFKTVVSRISRSKDGLTTDTEMADAEKAFNSVGVSIRGADGDFRDISDTLDDLNKVWGTLNKSQKSYIAEQAAGVRQKSVFLNMMDGYNKALQLEQEALNSSGTAMEINDKRADSIQGKMQKLSATMTELYSNALPDEAIEGVLDFATALAKVADNLGIVQGAIAALGVAGGTQVFSMLAANWTSFVTAFTSPLGIASVAVGGLVAAITSYRQAIDKSVESAKQAGDVWEKSNTSLQDQITKIEELRTAIDSGKLSEQEAYDAKSQLLDIQNQLAESYGSQVDGIDLVNGSLEKQISLLNELSQGEAQRYLNENRKGIAEAEKQMSKQLGTQESFFGKGGYYLGQFFENGSDEANTLKDILKKYKDVIDVEGNDVEKNIYFRGDATQAKETLNSLMTDIANAQKELGETTFMDDILTNAGNGLDEANGIIDKYKDLADQAAQARLVADTELFKSGNKNQTAAKWLKDYATAIEDYNNAIALGDDSEIAKSASNFEKIDSQINSLVNNTNMSAYSSQVDELRGQLNEAGLAANEFNKALAGSETTAYQKSIKSVVDEIKGLNLSDVDFKAAINSGDIESINYLSQAAEEAGISTDDLAQALVTLGIVSGNPSAGIEETTSSINDLAESSSNLISQINAVNSVLSSQSTGKSISIEDFNSDELKDYTSALEYNNGALQLNAKKVQELQKAKAEEAIQTNENQKLEKQSQYMKNIAEIEKLQDELRKLSDAKGENAQAIQNSIDALLSENDGLVNQCNQLDILSASLREATGAYQNWLDKQNTSEFGDMFDDAMGALDHIEDTVQNTKSEYYGRIGRESYKAAVEFLVPDTIDGQDAEAVSSYIDSIEHYFNHDSKGNRTGLDVAEFCAKATKAGLMELDKATNEYKILGQRTMEDFAEGLNLSLPMVQAMFGEMEEFNAKFDWSDEAVKTLGDMAMAAGEAKGRIEELSGDKNLDIQIDVSDIESTEDKISTLENTISQMQDYKSTLEVDSSQVDDANAIIQYCVTQKQMLEAPAVMSVDTSQVDGEIGNALSLLQQFQEAQNNVELQAAVGADTSEAQGKVDSLVSEIQGLSPEIKAQLGLDDSTSATITASIQALTPPELKVKAGVDTTEVDAYAAEEKQSNGTVTWGNDTGDVDAWAAQMHKSKGTVTWGNDITRVKTSFTATGTVNWTNTTPPSGGTHGLNGTAHASGTAQYPHLVGHANAKGNWGTKTGGITLVGELGREIVVNPYTGTWQTVGDNGAEFKYIPAGSIVFNHLQSESLLERGFVNSRGTAKASGTAMVTGGIPVKQANIASGHTTYTGSSYNNQNTKATNDNTSAKKENTKATEESTEAFDWAKRRLDKFARNVELISNKITDYISSALKTTLLKKQMTAIEKQIEANQKGYDTYMEKANAVGLSKEYRDMIINGSFKIEDIDTSTDSGKKLAEDIKDFESYYDSAIECKDKIQELNNTLLELYDTLANMPTEKAEKKIEKLKRKYESLSSVSDTISLGGSALSALTKQINEDNPKLATAQTNVTKAETARTKTKAARSTASKALQAAKSDTTQSGVDLKKAAKEQTTSIAKNLKKAAKSTTDKATYNALSKAIREGKSVSTKGLKGEALKYAKSYNKSLKQQDSISKAVDSGKAVSTSGMSKVLKAEVAQYNQDVKDQAAAQKAYDKARAADEKALEKLNKAKATKDEVYSQTTKEQQTLATNKSSKTYVVQNKLLDQELSLLKSENSARQTALKEINAEVKKQQAEYDKAVASRDKYAKSLLSNKSVTSALNKTQLAALKAGKTVSTKGITDPAVLKKIEAYNKKVTNASDLNKKLNIQLEAQADAVKNAAQAEAEYAQALVENEKKKLENISNYYESMLPQFENRNSLLQTYMDRMQTRGYNLSAGFYEEQIANQKQIANKQKAELAAMQKQFQESLDTGKIKVGTEEYYEMQDSIEQVTMSIAETTNNIVELEAAIRDLNWEQFDRLQESISRITSESDFLIDLMSYKDMYDKEGKITEQGLATMGLHGVNYNTYMAQADKYKEEMLRISEELAKDPYNQKLIDRKNELIDAQQKSILSAEAEKQAIFDLVENGIEAELDSLQDLIDKYVEAIENEKELYDYQKKIRDKSEEIASLQKRLISLQGDNSEETKAQVQELKVSLKNAQEDLEDTQYERYVSEQKKLLDNLYNDYEAILNQRMDDTDALLNDIIAEVNNGASEIQQTIASESKDVGYTLSNEMETIWSATNGVSGAISAYDSNFTSTMTGVNTAIGNVYTRQREMIDAIKNMTEKYIQKVEDLTKKPTPVEAILEPGTEDSKADDTVVDTGNNSGIGEITIGKVETGSSSGNSSGGATLGTTPKKPTSTPSTTTGDGGAKVGDVVTFNSGKYYAASDGTGASGNSYLGKKVKITRINSASWAKYPYCIVSADGKTSLGWVKLSQLKGYASGIKSVPDDELGWTQELGSELIFRPSENAMLTSLKSGDMVLDHEATENIWKLATDPSGYFNGNIMRSVENQTELSGNKNNTYINNHFDNITFDLPNVKNYSELVSQMQKDKSFERMIRAMTTDRILGKGSFEKLKCRF